MIPLLLLLAPAPDPEPPNVPGAFLGPWKLVWGHDGPGSRGACRLTPGGDWEAEINGTRWRGRWRLEGRTLVVTERQVCPCGPGAESEYRIRLDRTGRAGVVERFGFPFALLPAGRGP